MKILTFITSIDLKGGGPSRSVPMLVKGLAEAGVDVTLMTYRSDEMNTHALDGTSAKLKVLERNTSVGEIEQFIVAEGFQLIQIQSIWSIIYHKVAKIARRHGIPYIITPRGMLEPWSLSQKKWKKRLAMALYQKPDLNAASCIFTTAIEEAQHVHDLGISSPCSVIPNGIETEGYPCRQSMDVVKKQVLFLSRIHIKKGIELLLEAWQRLVADFPEWKVVIVGNGEADYIESLKVMARDMKIDKSVEILDPVFGQAKVQLYQESSVFCLPSYSENFGMVIAEAMSCGVPALTTTNCPWTLLNETDTGWCIDLSVDNLEKALRDALSQSPEHLYEMGQRASRLVYERYNYHNVALRTIELYKWLLGEGDKPDFVYEQ